MLKLISCLLGKHQAKKKIPQVNLLWAGPGNYYETFLLNINCPAGRFTYQMQLSVDHQTIVGHIKSPRRRPTDHCELSCPAKSDSPAEFDRSSR